MTVDLMGRRRVATRHAGSRFLGLKHDLSHPSRGRCTPGVQACHTCGSLAPFSRYSPPPSLQYYPSTPCWRSSPWVRAGHTRGSLAAWPPPCRPARRSTATRHPAPTPASPRGIGSPAGPRGRRQLHPRAGFRPKGDRAWERQRELRGRRSARILGSCWVLVGRPSPRE